MPVAKISHVKVASNIIIIRIKSYYYRNPDILKFQDLMISKNNAFTKLLLSCTIYKQGCVRYQQLPQMRNVTNREE